MFGLSMIQERLAFAAVLVLVVVGFAWHERYVGGQKCLQNVEKANAVEQVKEEKQHNVDTITVQSEGKAFADATSAPLATPAPIIRLGVCTKLPGKTVQGTPAAGSGPNATAPSGRGDSPPVTVWDTTSIVTTGRNADAQIRGLQAYITDVCRPK
jgi:hypothetical protein